MILPSTPDSSEEEGSGSPRKRPACHHNSTGSPLKHFALGSESTALTRDPVVSPFMNGFRTASLRPLPTKRLRQSTVPERTPPRQSNHIDSGSHSYETSSLSTTPSPSRVVGTPISAEAGNHAGPSASSSKVGHLPASDLTDGEALFCQQITSELREMAKYQRDLAKVRIQQVLFDVKYMSQAHAVGSSEELQRIQPTGVPNVPHLGQRAASIPAVNSSLYSTESLLLSKGARHPAFERAVSSV